MKRFCIQLSDFSFIRRNELQPVRFVSYIAVLLPRRQQPGRVVGLDQADCLTGKKTSHLILQGSDTSGMRIRNACELKVQTEFIFYVIQAPLPLPVDKVAANTPSMYSQELFQLSQYLQEALHREQMLEQKLATLQRLLASTQEASESSWQALIDEDRLLSRLEVMGNQLQAYSKNQTEDGIRKELIALTEDKLNYETTAKESLRRVLQEKIEVVRKLSEVERTLSNTEDECTHLKEMNERTQEELRELANKYNGALAEGKQEELTQKGQKETKELQLRIEEMEEKEQALQARIEALQADNDFTNERLTALQDHFLLKSGGDCTLIQQFIECQREYTEFFPLPSTAVLMKSLSNGLQSRWRAIVFAVKQLKGAVDSSIHKLSNFDEVIDAHLQNNQTTDDNSFTSPEKLKVVSSNLPTENQMDAKESEMSDTLSPSKDRSSDDTSDGQMDEQELSEPQNRVALIKGEAGDYSCSLRITSCLFIKPVAKDQTRGVFPLSPISQLDNMPEPSKNLENLTRQASDAKSNHFKLKSEYDISAHICIETNELQRANLEPGDTEQVIHQLHSELLEAQELANTGKQKCLELQGQLAKLQSDMEALREQRENTISNTRDELYSAQEEVLVLRHAMEAAMTERERDITALQADLSAVTAELDKWRQAASKYEQEISTLQENFKLQSQHQERAAKLQECESLRSEKVTLLEKLHKLEVELSSSREQSATLSSSLNALEKSQGDLENKLGSIQDKHQQDASRLKVELDRAETRTKSLQRESQLSDLRQRYEQTEQEKRSINDELEQCKVNLKLLQEQGKNSPWMPWMPMVAVAVAVTTAVLYASLSKSSS
ncbi:Sarcolemmal membrane-associated protein [Bagarius yarrelli]|uniref:Sarcolemmal membrane-associated protein n=1 Tax=Bagarius yarrelli TaxID=175774 RepID=A0A556U3Z3_BAGYA|nr:Sarcolemmal membrane-associated protein [Bagarius yarrelli]